MPQELTLWQSAIEEKARGQSGAEQKSRRQFRVDVEKKTCEGDLT